MKTPKPEENIEKCFEEIKQVLKKYECEICLDDEVMSIWTNDLKYHEYYSQKDLDA